MGFDPNLYNSSGYYPPQRSKTNGKAIAALVLGILSLIVPYVGILLGIIAIILAAISFKEIRRNGEQGKGMAIAGLVCAIIGTLIYALLLIFVVFAVAMYA
ncbi:DUF4190 domain-containing protein [Paenibacillus sp. NFR01]|uniref:DUF4190 domain-containing protein n=1 Tax=Paenibacillus sp. NFR01 TaxID=1566279 RepID=UPI0008C33544|nr:DUF4190 domain-containing protein [Paenibacillus sp. NFR01]SEU20284.1 protein of unknown function [Paenibacillus sp. NFR01]